ncbi:hypothetical protein STCU_10194 [Strigomonas culicis]|uniref:PSP1 C-terminal domain-containing protein n=1 Tax=Strigomonas culicis TaxID=28005 RepID=S9TJ79_9TRYP|nr:hypothetical protein STCU_10194 [Strigomonas culicis]|eukprot:EPY18097.1 hypothetical protein STCU_10194 [Strigomonas culicis]
MERGLSAAQPRGGRPHDDVPTPSRALYTAAEVEELLTVQLHQSSRKASAAEQPPAPYIVTVDPHAHGYAPPAGATNTLNATPVELLATTALPLRALVLFEGDRGTDCGVVTGIAPLAAEEAHAAPKPRKWKRVLRLATEQEAHYYHHVLPQRAAEEALPYAQQTLVEYNKECTTRGHNTNNNNNNHNNANKPYLSIAIVGAKYQFDGEKLTFYYTSSARVDFRPFVHLLFSYFHCRIWMEQVEGGNNADTWAADRPRDKSAAAARSTPSVASVEESLAPPTAAARPPHHAAAAAAARQKHRPSPKGAAAGSGNDNSEGQAHSRSRHSRGRRGGAAAREEPIPAHPPHPHHKKRKSTQVDLF